MVAGGLDQRERSPLVASDPLESMDGEVEASANGDVWTLGVVGLRQLFGLE